MLKFTHQVKLIALINLTISVLGLVSIQGHASYGKYYNVLKNEHIRIEIGHIFHHL